MLISDAIALLKSAELKQLSVKNNDKAIMGFINFGILELYKRFNLWEKEFLITQVTDVLIYDLDGTDLNVTMDLTDHQFMMVERMFDEDDFQMVLNDDTDKESIITPRYNQVEFTKTLDDTEISGIYRAAPVFLDNEKDTIPLPPQFFEALFHYVGYRGHGSVKGDIKSENNSHYMRFEKSCDRVKYDGLFIQDDLVSSKFVDRGFV